MTKANVKKSGGILGGIIILIVGIVVLWNNEGRAVKTLNAIKEVTKKYTDVSSKKIDSEYDGKVVSTSGKIDLGDSVEVRDPKFDISVKAVKLKRIVEMYQWNESCTTDDNDKETCSYDKDWSEDKIDSSEFKKEGHENPSLLFESDEYVAASIKVGEYVMPERLITKLSYDKKLNNEQLESKYKNTVEGYKVKEKYITNSADLNKPEIGDIRVSYEYASDGEVSMMGVQKDDTLAAYTAKKGKSILEIRRGSYTGKEILISMANSNKTLTWFLRILGTLLVIGGIASLFNPLQLLTNKIPLLGSIVNFSANVFSSIVGLALSLIIIAIAWFRFRPVLSIVLLVIVAGLIVYLKTKEDKNPKKIESE